MTLRHIGAGLRHPFMALFAAAIFAGVGVVALHGGVSLLDQAAIADDPVKISDRALEHRFDSATAEREIRAALAANDVDLAQSFVALAADRGVAVDPSLADSVKSAGAQDASFSNKAGRFVHGLWTGEPTDLTSLAGAAFGDLFVFGDIRDAAREGTRYLSGEPYDPWILGLAGVGLGITAATYATLGAGTPERVGVSVVKAAKRVGKLNPALVTRVAREAVKVENAGGLVELAGNVGRVERKAGTQAALDTLAVSETPQDVSRMATLATASGGKTRAIVKLLGRAAIVLATSSLELAGWALWAAFAVFGFCASCKAMAERLTERHLARRRAVRFRKTIAGVPVAAGA